MTNLRKNPIKTIHQDKYADIQKENDQFSIYNTANKILTPAPYAKRKYILYQVARIFSNIYHPFSFLLSLATVFLLVNIFAGNQINDFFSSKFDGIKLVFLSIAVIVGIISIFLLVALEYMKAHYATDLNKSRANDTDIKSTDRIILYALVAVSITISAIGGGALSYFTSDQSHIITNDYQLKKDSIVHKISPEIEKSQVVIDKLETLQGERIKKGWTLTTEEWKNLNDTKADKRAIQSKLDDELLTLKNEYNANIIDNVDTTSLYIWVTVLIVFICELLNIHSYYLKFEYLRRVRDESENIGFQTRVKEESNSLPPTLFSKSHQEFMDEIFSKFNIAYQDLKNLLLGVPNPIESEYIYKRLIADIQQMNVKQIELQQNKTSLLSQPQMTISGFKRYENKSSIDEMKMNNHNIQYIMINQDELNSIKIELDKLKNLSEHPLNKANRVKEEKKEEKWKMTEEELIKAFKTGKCKTIKEGRIASGMSQGKVWNIKQKAETE